MQASGVEPEPSKNGPQWSRQAVRTQMCSRRARMRATETRDLRVSTFLGMHNGHACEGVATYQFTTQRSRAVHQTMMVDFLCEPKPQKLGFTFLRASIGPTRLIRLSDCSLADRYSYRNEYTK
ncbi:hypothetical protein CRG98_010742 [Punica granatum]|uniref:Uncharacterized protein n=1 Tax=Punica granatum TaxID=22663 RepID=A0A2I0KK37_PUNGR|nr:hypothetical protein CRG98_010742 [Punica granatum]